MTVETLIDGHLTLFLVPRLVVMVVLILGATATGIAVALKNGDFQWLKVGDFLQVMVLPLFVGWLSVELLAYALSVLPDNLSLAYDTVAGLAYAAYGGGVLSLFSRLMRNLEEVGISIPGSDTIMPFRKDKKEE